MKKRLTFKQLLFEQQVLGILLFSVLVVFLWVVSTIYFSYSATTLSEEDVFVVTPLNPTIDDKPLRVLQERRWWTETELQNFTVSSVVRDGEGNIKTSTTISPTVSPTASTSATPVPSPTSASGSAQTQ